MRPFFEGHHAKRAKKKINLLRVKTFALRKKKKKIIYIMYFLKIAVGSEYKRSRFTIVILTYAELNPRDSEHVIKNALIKGGIFWCQKIFLQRKIMLNQT